MSDPRQANAEETAAWHRHFAISGFNRSWDLLDAPERDEAADDELLAVAFASRWHWGEVGTVENRALGDHQIAKVASVYEGMARACHAAGDVEGRDGWLGRSRDALDAIADPEERAVIEDQLAQIPGWA